MASASASAATATIIASFAPNCLRNSLCRDLRIPLSSVCLHTRRRRHCDLSFALGWNGTANHLLSDFRLLNRFLTISDLISFKYSQLSFDCIFRMSRHSPNSPSMNDDILTTKKNSKKMVLYRKPAFMMIL